MKVEFDRTKAWWDDWRRFYNGLPFGYVFESGEAIVTTTAKDVSTRRMWSTHNVSIVATTDDGCPALYVPGEDKPIPKAWLDDSGIQVLLVDWCTSRVVRLTHAVRHSKSTNEGWRAQVPVALRARATAYCPGEGMPVLGDPVAVSPPRVLLKHEKHVIETNIAASKAWLALEADSPELSAIRGMGYYARRDAKVGRHLDTTTSLRPFDDLTPVHRWRLGHHGVASERVRTLHDYLIVKENRV
jgi:hypothetical protein